MNAAVPPNAPAVHAPLDWPVVDGELQVGGVGVRRLAAQVGATPFYAYDRGRLAARIERLRRVLPPAVRVHYAMKANPMPALVAFMATRVDGIDVASAGEMAVALDAGAPPADVSFAGPGKTAHELERAVAAGVLVNVESARELPHLAQASQRLGVAARVALRLNPGYELRGSAARMGGGAKPFGVDAEQAPALLDAVRAHGLAFEGLHLFAGSQSLNAQAIVQAQREGVALARALADRMPAPLRTLNLGGGFGIPYFPGERALDVAPIGEALHGLADEVRAAFGAHAAIALELGRWLVGEAGVYVTRVVDRKVSRGTTYLVCDGGLHHHLTASGNFGQVLRKNLPLRAAEHLAAAAALETVTVVGPLCTPLDVLGDRVAWPAGVGEGALVAVFQSGAYGASASPQDFLGHPHCREILVGRP